MSAPVGRYHPLLVALHWLFVPAVVGNLVLGPLLLEGMANTDPSKPAVLRLHMALGLSVALLLVIRLIVRLRTAKPKVPHAGGLKWLAVGNHWALYAVLLATVMTGLGTAQLAGLFPILEGKTPPLPASFDTIPPFAGHELFSTVLIGLLALHLGAVVWHALVKRENILPRMWFGGRRSD